MSKWRWFWIITTIFGVIAFGLGAGCSNSSVASTTQSTPVTTFDRDRAFSDLKQQVDFGYRIPGTATQVKTRDWLVAQLKPNADTVDLQPFSKQINDKNVPMWNIIATLRGTGVAPRERVLLCAHWDSRPIADHDPDPANRTKPIPGANDGASGVAVLLEIARQLKAHPIARDVTIVLFDGEDYGPNIDNMLLGSKYYAAHLPADKPNWGILLDMVGDKDLDIPRELYSQNHAQAVNDRIWSAAYKLALMKTDTLSGFVDSTNDYEITDDHTPLNEAGIPVADVIDFTYTPWHTISDTVDKCSPESLRIVGVAVEYAISTP